MRTALDIGVREDCSEEATVKLRGISKCRYPEEGQRYLHGL